MRSTSRVTRPSRGSWARRRSRSRRSRSQTSDWTPVRQGKRDRRPRCSRSPIRRRAATRARSKATGTPRRRSSTSSRRSGSYERRLDGAHQERRSGSVSVLVFLEHHGNELQKGSLGVLSKAATLGAGDVAAVLVGGGVRALASEAGKFGASKVHVLEDDALEPPLPQPRVDAIAKAFEDGGYDTVLLANSVLAADIAAGLSARLDAGLNWDLVDITSDFTGKRPALQDSVFVDVGWRSTPRIGLFRAGSF